MPQENITIHSDSNNITGLDILADESVIFEIRSSVTLLVMQLIGLVILAVGVVWLFVHFQVASKIGLGDYKMWVNMLPALVVGITALSIIKNWYATKYLLTTKRVQVSYKFLTAYDKSITLDKVNSVKCRKSFGGMIFNYGTIVIKSAAANFELEFVNISDAQKYLQTIEDNL